MSESKHDPDIYLVIIFNSLEGAKKWFLSPMQFSEDFVTLNTLDLFNRINNCVIGAKP